MTNDEGMTKSECRRRSAILHSSFGFASSFSLFSASPDAREDEMKFFRFHPQLARFRFLFWNCADCHPQKIFRFTRLLLAGAATLETALLRHRSITLDIVLA